MRPMPRLSAALAAALCLAAPAALGAQEPVVHALLFYSPTCPHCHEVINNVLPPLRDKYGERLVIVGVDVTTQRGQGLYQAMASYFALPESRLGVPALLVGTDVMVGSLEIPERFPGAIERGLAAGGIPWPPVEEIRQVLASEGLLEDEPSAAAGAAPAAVPTSPDTAPAASGPPAAAPETAPTRSRPDTEPGTAGATAATAPAADTDVMSDTARAEAVLDATLTPDTALSLERPTMAEIFLGDPLANAIAVVVLLLLLGTLARSVRVLVRPGAAPGAAWPAWVFPVLGLVGIGVAAYLSYVELTGARAVCGPVGDCNTVQQSAWSRLFGVPVGVLGLAGYAAMLAAWALASWGPPAARGTGWKLAWILAFAGTAFSAWLTFLEPFVIGATCAWCLTSAVVVALMLAAGTSGAARSGSS